MWVGAPHWVRGTLGGVAWHAHEMLWGFIAANAVGFLLTAGTNWSGVNPLRGTGLASLCGLWLIARAAFLLPGPAWFYLAGACELAFFGGSALALGRALVKGHNRRNYGVPLLLVTLGIADALYLTAVLRGDHTVLMQRFTVGLTCMTLVALFIARRVIPFFAMRAVAGLQIPMHTRSGQWQLGAAALAIVSGLLDLEAVMATSLAISGGIAFVQLSAWKPLAVRGQPLLWILYAGYAGLAAGLLVAAVHAVDEELRLAWPAHVIGMGGFSVLIIGMVTRTALGHLGQPLQVDRTMLASYALVIVAAALRLLALLPSEFALSFLRGSAAAWVLAFALYLWRFAPMLVRPRADP
jgi:uncharacterized protein involved in response to NO